MHMDCSAARLTSMQDIAVFDMAIHKRGHGHVCVELCVVVSTNVYTIV